MHVGRILIESLHYLANNRVIDRNSDYQRSARLEELQQMCKGGIDIGHVFQHIETGNHIIFASALNTEDLGLKGFR